MIVGTNRIDDSVDVIGYKVRRETREAFVVHGYTLIIPADCDDRARIDRFWEEVRGDGRLDDLCKAVPHSSWILGMGSWDLECPKRGQRYTICVDDSAGFDPATMSEPSELFSKQIKASDWLCFEIDDGRFPKKFWEDDPYIMLKILGYEFNTAGFSIGMHFDAYPIEGRQPHYSAMEFWISVKP